MSRPVQGRRNVKKEPFPWLLLLAFLGSLALFWALPHYLGSRKVNVEFTRGEQ